jgi:hypothetical protein
MRYAVAFALILTHATPAFAQNGKWNVTPPQPYTRADFTRDCIKLAPAVEPARSDWIKRCSKEAP